MTHFKFFKRNGCYYGFTVHGHSGFDDSGHDIVCAAFSAMTMLVIEAAEVAFASDVDYTIDDDNNEIRVFCMSALPEFSEDEKKQYAVSGIFMAYYLQLNEMLEEYYDYLEIEEIEE